MTPTLPRVTHEHHERLMQHVDEMPAVGKMILTAPIEDLRPRLAELDGWLTDLLIPHLEAAEKTLYPELERMLQNRHSMAPMRREHAEIRLLVAEYSRLLKGIGDQRPRIGKTVALRRVLFRLYALLEVHLVEEEVYIPIINHGVTDEAAEVMAAALNHSGIPKA
ncbi:MAG: hemerythrin domain-containing protein [Candidatus Limnocylindria bacterium]